MSELQYEPIPQRSSKWWECEQPEIVQTDKNVLKFYQRAKKLQVSKPNWTNDYGESKPGKTVVLDLAEPTVIALIQKIINLSV